MSDQEGGKIERGKGSRSLLGSNPATKEVPKPIIDAPPANGDPTGTPSDVPTSTEEVKPLVVPPATEEVKPLVVPPAASGVESAPAATPAAINKVTELIKKYKDARKKRSTIEETLRSLTAKLDALEAQAKAKKSKGKKDTKGEANTTPFTGTSEIVHILFVLCYILVRLLNQTNIPKSAKATLLNYFEQFRKMIDIYEHMLIIGHTINYPKPVDKKEEGEEEKEKEKPKEGEAPKDAEPIQEDATLIRELKAFHVYIYMVIANPKLQDMYTNALSSSFDGNIKWIDTLTAKEGIILISRESLVIQQKLYDNVINRFMMQFAKFEIAANLSSAMLADQQEIVKKLNESVNKFNSSDPPQDLEANENAKVQIAQLKDIMDNGPVPIKDPMVLESLATKMGEDAKLIKNDIIDNASPKKAITKGMFNSLSGLFKDASDYFKKKKSGAPAAPGAPVTTFKTVLSPEIQAIQNKITSGKPTSAAEYQQWQQALQNVPGMPPLSGAPGAPGAPDLTAVATEAVKAAIAKADLPTIIDAGVKAAIAASGSIGSSASAPPVPQSDKTVSVSPKDTLAATLKRIDQSSMPKSDKARQKAQAIEASKNPPVPPGAASSGQPSTNPLLKGVNMPAAIRQIEQLRLPADQKAAAIKQLQDGVFQTPDQLPAALSTSLKKSGALKGGYVLRRTRKQGTSSNRKTLRRSHH